MSLHREVDALIDNEDTWEHAQRLFTIEADYKRQRMQLMLLPSVSLIYAGLFGMFVVLKYVNIIGFVKEMFGVSAPERLITFGVAGAFLYLATSILSSITNPGEKVEGASKVADFSIRLLLAIVVPIILVSLFFTADGKLAEVTISPELLALGCGYSAKIVIDFMNKIVEKISKMLEAV